MRPPTRPTIGRRRVVVAGAVGVAAWSQPTVVALGQVPSCVPSAGMPTESIAVPGNGTILDTWRSNMVINETRFYTNTTGAPQTVHPTTVSFESGRAGIPFTPFFVRILGNDSFVVLAVGATRLSANLGTNTFSFDGASSCFSLPAGARLGIGFLDANADGSGSVHSTVRWTNGGDEIWYTGGPGANNAASVTVGAPPTPGARTLTHLRRRYHVDFRFQVA